MLLEERDLLHYGVIRRSGRYPWGSGGPEYPSTNPNKRNKQFLDYVEELKARGLTEKEIAKGIGSTIIELRAAKSNAKNAVKMANITMAQRLADKGNSTTAIAERMKESESTVRSWLEPGAKEKLQILTSTSDMLRKEVDAKKYIDVGKGIENHLNISATKLNNAVAALREEGYELRNVSVPQITTGKETNMKVLCPPGTTQKDLFLHRFEIQFPGMKSDNGGREYYGLHPPLQIDPKRLLIKYAEDGGGKADGAIFVRRGVDDISLGKAQYGQVRVMIGPDHYMKGMALYNDNIPNGVDLVFHTKKSNTGNKLDALKRVEEGADKTNPFGSMIRDQIIVDKGTSKERLASAMNLVNEEGNWEVWSNIMSSQMLSKQSPALVKSQLGVTKERREMEYREISALTNATVRRKLLEDFADASDAASVHLKAAAMPRQSPHVILPLSTISPSEVYAPNYRQGERVALIRHPHGGTFEIPDLIVNKRNAEGRRLLGDSRDAIGIHHEVATRLSGADFDGDAVLVIPNNQGRLKITPALKDLKDFDPISAYPGYKGMKVLKNTDAEMGSISNLITDMTIHNAPQNEIARAIKHSMVVIDAAKHGLDHKRSANDNGIKELKQKYQKGGASTLISRARSPEFIPERVERKASRGGKVNRVTGEREFEPTGRLTKAGEPRKMRVPLLSVTRDARALSSGTIIEGYYATYSNDLKAMANRARLDAIKTPATKVSASAKRTYSTQVASLDAKLALAREKAPLERQAQIIANVNMKAKRDANPDMDPKVEKKIRYLTLDEARNRMDSKKDRIVITTDEWEAIQAGAISDSKLREILTNADMDVVKQLATPKQQVLMTSTMTSRAKQMFAQGYDRAEVAEQLGVSLSTLDASVTGSEA